MSPKAIVIMVLIGCTLVLDMLFSLVRYPVLTISVCGIVVLYELVSPYIYRAR